MSTCKKLWFTLIHIFLHVPFIGPFNFLPISLYQLLEIEMFFTIKLHAYAKLNYFSHWRQNPQYSLWFIGKAAKHDYNISVMNRRIERITLRKLIDWLHQGNDYPSSIDPEGRSPSAIPYPKTWDYIHLNTTHFHSDCDSSHHLSLTEKIYTYIELS